MTAPSAHEEALARIEHLSRPGQTLGISEAIDLLCDIYNECRKARAVVKEASQCSTLKST